MAIHLGKELEKIGILGKKLPVVEFRIGMPGTLDEGKIFGIPKRYTRYPIDHVKIINYTKGQERGILYIELFSEKAGSKAITWGKLSLPLLYMIILKDSETDKDEDIITGKKKSEINDKKLEVIKKIKDVRLEELREKYFQEKILEEFEKKPILITDRTESYPLVVAKKREYPLEKIGKKEVVKREEGYLEELGERHLEGLGERALVEVKKKKPKPKPRYVEREEFCPCPICSHINKREMHTLRPVDRIDNETGYPIYVCDHCGSRYVFTGTAMLAIQPGLELPFDCPECGHKLKVSRYQDPQAGIICRLQCVHPNCRARTVLGPLQPWFLDLSERDYNQWLKTRATMLLGEPTKQYIQNKIQALKVKHGVGNVGPYGVINQDVKDAVKNLGRKKSKEFWYEYSKDRHGIQVRNELIKKFGFTEDELERFSEEEQKAFRELAPQIDKMVGEKTNRFFRDVSARDYKERKGRLEEGIGKIPVAGKAYNGLNWLADKTGHYVKDMFFALLLITMGVIIAGILGNQWFLFGFLAWGLMTIVPDPERLVEKKTLKDYELITAPNQPPRWSALGSLFANKDNSTHTGFAISKTICKLATLFFFGWAFYSSHFPLANLVLLVFCFAAYFSLPVTYDVEKPYEIIQSFARIIVALFIATAIFGIGVITSGIFNAPLLGWLTVAFLVVFPVPKTSKGDIARALGLGASQVAATYETFDKIIFILIMMVTGGAAIFGLPLFGGWDLGLSSTGGIVFASVWGLSFVTGVLSPAETRPSMGIVMLLVAFVIFGLGPGSQDVGSAFFGQWWPTVHNTAIEIMKPIGGIFQAFQNTFGNVFLLITNPVAYAHQIMDGSYVKDDITGRVGAYGLEIERMQVASIYPEQPFMISFELFNKGGFDAKNISIDLWSPIKYFKINDTSEHPLPQNWQEKREYNKDLYAYDYPEVDNDLKDINHQDMKLIFLTGIIKCDIAKEIRERYVTIESRINYDYHVESNLQIKFLSTDEWNSRLWNNNLARSQVFSKVSTAPVKLSIGTVDQPSMENYPFYIGFNLTSQEPNSKIKKAEVDLIVPKEFHEGNRTIQSCTVKYENYVAGEPPPLMNEKGEVQGYIMHWEFSEDDRKEVFCYYNKAPNVSAPEKTFTIFARANYTFEKWEAKDTQIAFQDVCPEILEKLQETPKFGDIPVKPEVPILPEMDVTSGGATVLYSELQKQDYSITEEQINKYLNKNAKGALATLGSPFYTHGMQYNIDPAFAVAVAMLESDNGNTPPAKNNFFGLKNTDGVLLEFDSPENGILEFYIFVDSYVKKGINTSDGIGCDPSSGFSCEKWKSRIPALRSAVNAIYECANLPRNFVAGWDKYSSDIRAAINKYNLHVYIENADALIAAIISTESAWRPNAVSPCGAAGIMQFIPSTARKYGLNVPVYDRAYCSNICKINGNVIPVSVCSSCTPEKCDYINDERFNPSKAINSAAGLIYNLLYECDWDLEDAIKAYNSGKCGKEANSGYYDKIDYYYKKWKDCLKGPVPVV